MTEMTPEMEDLRRIAGHLVDIEEGGYARRVDRALRAWEAEVRAWKDAYAERDRAHNVLVVHIEALASWGERAEQALVYAATVVGPNMDKDIATRVDKACMDLSVEWALLATKENP